MKKIYTVSFIVPFLLIIAFIPTLSEQVFAMHQEMPHHDDTKSTQKMMGHHHTPHNGICAPGFTSLGEICVLNDRCGSGAYAGRVCVMDGKTQPYLKPLHQKYSGISVENIICAEGKKLIFKHHDASPGCVHANSVEKLKQRGWQTELPIIACTLEYNPVCGMDGKTYGNPCSLGAAHMAMMHQGECVNLITNFEECSAAGNPIMESYPRQCRTEDGKHFVETIPNQN